jgi:hypothetical protein
MKGMQGWLVIGIWLLGAVPAFAGTKIITVTGTVDDAVATVTVNGAAATLTGGSFSTAVTLTEGDNTITAVASDPAGNSSSASVEVSLDTVPPVIVISSPTDGQLFGAQ